MNVQNEILYQSICFFLNETENCHFQKLSKLIYLFDLNHIRSIGLPATGAIYLGLESGPDLNKFLIEDKDFEKHFKTINLMLTPMFTLDLDVFSSHQISILHDLVCKDKHDKNWINNIIHHKKDPWHIFYEIHGQKEKEIPMVLAFGNDEKSNMLKSRFEEMS